MENTALKRIDISKGRFVANKKTYIIETGFSIERYAMYQKLQIETGFGVTFEDMFKNWETVVTLANNLKFSDIVILSYNMGKGMMKLEEKEPLVLKMCALFINEEKEDRRTINDDMISQKIHDWKEEGYDVRDFFTLALNTINGYIDSWKKLTQAISENTETVEQSVKK